MLCRMISGGFMIPKYAYTNQTTTHPGPMMTMPIWNIVTMDDLVMFGTFRNVNRHNAPANNASPAMVSAEIRGIIPESYHDRFFSGYNPFMDIPDICPHCGTVNMIDWTKLERRPLSKVIWVEGYTCQQCNRWKPCWYSNRLLEEALRKLESMPPRHASFAWHFLKAIKRAQDIQKRGMDTDGSLRHQNLVVSG